MVQAFAFYSIIVASQSVHLKNINWAFITVYILYMLLKRDRTYKGVTQRCLIVAIQLASKK